MHFAQVRSIPIILLHTPNSVSGGGWGREWAFKNCGGRMPRPLALAMTCLLIIPRTSDRYGVAWLGSAGLGSAGLGKPGLGWARLGFARLGWVVLGCAGLP